MASGRLRLFPERFKVFLILVVQLFGLVSEVVLGTVMGDTVPNQNIGSSYRN